MKKTSIFDSRNFDFHLASISYDSAKVGSYQSGTRRQHELIYKLDGHSQQVFDGLVIDLIPDSIYYIPKGILNAFTVTEPGTIINIRFTLYGDAENTAFLPELIPLEAGNRYKSMFLRASELWRKKEPAYYLHTHALVSKILASLMADREQQYMQSSKYALIAPALDHIRAHFREPISIVALAELCGISDEYLRTLFRSYTGQTPLSYINTLRLEHARELLQSGYVSVAETAQQSGFESPEYFSRIFKKRYNISPSKLNTVQIQLPSIFNQNEEESKP